MKRATTTTTSSSNSSSKKHQAQPKGIALGYLEFSIEACRVPKANQPFDGYFLGTVFIHACPLRPTLVGCRLTMKNEALMSIAPYFVYSTKAACDTDNTLVVDKKAELCNVQRLKQDLTKAHCKELIDRMMNQQNLPLELRQIGHRLVMNLASSLPSATVAKALPKSDLFRLPLKQVLYGYFVTSKHDVKQKKALEKLSLHEMHALKRTLITEPWSLVWNDKRAGYGGCFLTEQKMRQVIDDYSLHFRFPLHIQYAVAIYFRLLRLREDEQHTCFPKQMFNMMIPCIELEKRQLLEKQVYAYLYEKALVLFPTPPPPAAPFGGGGGDNNASVLPPPPAGGAGEFLSLHSDYRDAELALKALLDIQKRALLARHEPFELRGKEVPQLFPELTARQTEIAHHIQRHWLTIVEGLPGTGKTALITWCVSYYQNVMLTSFVGMMVKSLQRRNGKRKEVAHTIHHLIAVSKYNQAAAAWFAKFEVLVLDEFSNVSMPLFRKLLCLFPNLSKLVLVGDHRQLKPIDGGDPMGDLLSMFGSQMLYDNLRVVPGLRNLQMAPHLISEGRANEISFTGPITFLNKLSRPCVREVLLSTFKPYAGRKNILMNMHIVVLVHKGNDGRKHLNSECEAAWQQLGVLKRPPQGGVLLTGGSKRLELYPGCKITFGKNYNTPIEFTDVRGDKQKSATVANGELAIVKDIQIKGNGFVLTVVDSEEEADDPETKVLWIEQDSGIHPMHIDLGYATTTYRTQGKAKKHSP